MPILDFFKNIYYKGENRWYDFLDKVDKKIPIYKIVDPIDKIVPSFVLFLLLILFLIILLGYLIRLSSPYEVTFTVFDAADNKVLQGVALSGAINESPFDSKITDSSGKTQIQLSGPKYNFYDLVINAFFQTKETFVAQITAKKTGYQEIKDKIIPFENKEVTLKLNKLDAPPTFSDQLVIELYDKDSSEKIIDETKKAYIKYACKNRNVAGAPLTVLDDQDGSVNGSFLIIQENCHVIITEASSPGYITMGASITINPQLDKEKIYLNKIGEDTGIANVFVYDKNGNNKRGLKGITVNFNKGSIIDSAITNLTGTASKNLGVGEYIITIRDENYAPITLDSNKLIKIKKGEQTSIEIELTPSNNLGMIYLKVVDENNTPIQQASIILVTIQKTTDGNLFGANPNSNRMEFSSEITDINGLLKRNGYVFGEKIIAVVSKQSSTKNYLTEFVLANIVKYSGTYQVVTLKEATPLNSASSTVNVRDIDNNKPIPQALTYLYYSAVFGGTLIPNIPINPQGQQTDNLGNANYSFLRPGIYAAAADTKEGGYFSRISSGQNIDANQKKDFNIYLNLRGSTLNFKLIDFITRNEITGSVSIYYLNSDGSRTLIETISTKSDGYYKSTVAYKKTDLLLVEGKSTNYVSTQLYLGGEQPLRVGENYYNLKLIPSSALDPNKRVHIFFEDVYSINESYWEGDSKVYSLEENEKYVGVFKIVIDGNVDHNELLSLSRVIGAGQITNTRVGLFGEPRKTQTMTNCDTRSLDSITTVHNDDYYFPNENTCLKVQKFIQGAFKWEASPLWKTTYTMVIDFNIDSNSKGKELEIHYRAKEKDSNGVTETALFKEQFIIGEPIRNGLFFKIEFNNQNIIVSTSTTKIQNLLLSRATKNSLKLTLINRTASALSNNSLNAYSYVGSINQFNTSLENGYLFFDEGKTIRKKSVSSNINILKNNSVEFTLDAWSERESYLVLVISSPSEADKKFFIKTNNVAKTMILDKANFLAGVVDQTYYAEVRPTSGNDSLKILSSRIKVFKNCRTNKTLANITPNPISINSSSNLINNNTFSVVIPGIYQYNRDCVEVEVDAQGLDGEIYETIKKTIYAGSGGTLDTELNCISIDLNGAEPNDEFEPTLKLDWSDKTELSVTNKNCAKDVIVAIDSGLVCKIKGTTNDCNGTTLGIGEKVTFDIIAKNIDYNPALPKPNFSDVLGYYPIYVKAKFVGNTKTFSIAKMAHISIYNSSQCFAISKDYFDFIKENSSEIEFDLISKCQYIEIGDYYTPKANLTAFGYDLNIGKIIYNQIQYQPIITVIGQTYDITRTTNTYNYWTDYKDFNKKIWEDVNIETHPEDYDNREVHFYKNLRFDLSRNEGEFLKLKFNFTDYNYEITNNVKQGFEIDGNLKITYKDNNIIYLKPEANFSVINSPVVCATGSGSNCRIINSNLDNELSQNEKRADLISGTITLTLPISNKEIKWVDMNVKGNLWEENLNIRYKSLNKIVQIIETYTLSSDVTSETFNLTNGPLSIPALEGVEFVIKSLSDSNIFKNTAFIRRNNPKVYLSSGSPNVLLWIEGDLLKAKFVGSDQNLFNDKIISGVITKEDGQGINYGIIEITDYVNPLTSNIISGIQ